MNNFKKRISKVKNIIKPYIDALGFENDRQMRNDIKATANNELNVSVFRVCRNQADRNDITQEMKKYLIGKMYRAIINMDKNLISNYKLFLHYNGHSSYRNGLEIADALGKEFNISGASVVKYDLYARSIDDINIKQSVSAADILSGVDKISIENTIKLSKMTDDDINYLKMLFGKQFYKLTGYMCIKGSAAQDTFERTNYIPAAIKHMPPHDPDAMINSLSFTIPSWIKSLQRTSDKSDMSKISVSAGNNLECKLNQLKNTIDNTLKNLEERKK